MMRHIASSISNTPCPTIIELGSEHGGTDITKIAGIGPTHPPPPPAPLMHMETSPGLPMTTLMLDDNDSNASGAFT